MPLHRSLAALMFSFVAATAAAQVSVRVIPADAQRGKLVAIEINEAKIDRKVFRMAPGARILNANNLTVTPNQTPTGVLVRYQVDGQGQIRTIWVLAPDEVQRR